LTNNILRNVVKSNTVSETKVSEIDSNQKDNKHNPVSYCTSVKEPAKEPKRRLKLNITYKIKQRPNCNGLLREIMRLILFQRK